MSGWQLAWPWALAALAALPAYGLWRWRDERRRRVPFAPRQLGPRHGPPRWLDRLLIPAELALLAVLTLALAGPYRSSEITLFEEEGIDVTLVLDVSLSMLAEDLPPNRLEVTRRLAGRFLDRRTADRVGIVIFAGEAFVQTPLTTDRAALAELLEEVTVYAIDQGEGGGTAIGDALLVAGDQLAAARVEGRDQAVVLITDGETNLGIDPRIAARWLAEQGVRLFAVGVGGAEPVAVSFEGRPVGGGLLTALDESELREVAAAAGGRFDRALDAGSFEAIFAELARLTRAPLETVPLTRRHPVAHRLAQLALGLFALWAGLAAGVLRRPLA